MHPTLQDVADRAGVHRTTVSLALRNHPRIPLATRRKIQTLAKRMGYRVNPLVAALMRSRRAGTAPKHLSLGFVTNYPTRFGWRPPNHDRPDFFPGAVARAADFGYKLEHFWLGEHEMTPARFCDVLTVRNVHGILIGRLPPGQATLDLAWDRFSCVALGMTLQQPNLHRVTENHFGTVWHAMERCRELGYRKIGFVRSSPDDSPPVGAQWISAYLGQQQRFGMAGDPPPYGEQVEPGAVGFRAWLERWRPDALIVTHADPVLHWLRAAGREVPRDMGMVELAHYHPELGRAGMYYDAAKVGNAAIELLVAMLHRGETGVPEDPSELVLSGSWHDGQTLPRRKAASRR